MKVLSKKLAALRLGAYLGLIRACFVNAWREYHSLPIEQRVKFTPRTRANAIHDLIVRNIYQAFDGIGDVRLLEMNQLFLMAVGCDLVLRFKKLDDSFRASGIPTQQHLDFGAQADLPGIEQVTHLEAGYRLNKLHTELEGVYICCPSGARVLWHFEIEPEESDAASNVIPLPRPAAPTRAVHFSDKLDEEKKEESGDDGES